MLTSSLLLKEENGREQVWEGFQYFVLQIICRKSSFSASPGLNILLLEILSNIVYRVRTLSHHFVFNLVKLNQAPLVHQNCFIWNIFLFTLSRNSSRNSFMVLYSRYC